MTAITELASVIALRLFPALSQAGEDLFYVEL
jgi:hypothetical protein